MTRSRLRIERLAAQYLIPRAHPDPAALGLQLDAAARALPGRLGAALAPHVDDGSHTVWLLREIAVDLTLDAAAGPDALAAQWGEAIARAALRRLDAGAHGVVMFADHAAYLAAFLADLAGGDAWSLWYYAGFDGLRALPVAAALRTALLADPIEGRGAL